MIESVDYQLRKITKTRGHCPSDDVLIKLLDLGCREIGRTDRGKGRGGRNGYIWKSAINQFEIMHPDRLRLA
jgi:putative transposase